MGLTPRRLRHVLIGVSATLSSAAVLAVGLAWPNGAARLTKEVR